MSSITRSVKVMSLSNFSMSGALFGLKAMPDVSRQVWMPFAFAREYNSIRKSICIRGSPPVVVMPPPF